MKIKITPFKKEFEFTPQELRELYEIPPVAVRVGIMMWLKQKFDLDILPKQTKSK